MDSEVICNPKNYQSLTDSVNNIGLRDASASKNRSKTGIFHVLQNLTHMHFCRKMCNVENMRFLGPFWRFDGNNDSKWRWRWRSYPVMKGIMWWKWKGPVMFCLWGCFDERLNSCFADIVCWSLRPKIGNKRSVHCFRNVSLTNIW